MHYSDMRISEWLIENRKTDAWLAAQIGRERSFVTRIKLGYGKPSLATMEAIAEITKGAVAPNDFVDMSKYVESSVIVEMEAPEW